LVKLLRRWRFLKDFLTVGQVKRVELRHHTKLRGVRSNCCRYGDFSIFQDDDRLDFYFQNFNGQNLSGGPNGVIMSNFVAIGQTFAEIW